ncbi:universal stress protein [Actinoplanes lobatus]|uniref:Nucleotide-binding universal stress UspA family protein n=1 Tax=Actinoplanes lobatus TaxID=113568 RepID=A0A7W7HN66_9ACTN|nr:universal stress protein [Actinoplanes lobatus]MBB4753595.1 nucleotide-binding universal stress UspA family protein [Actinoplanes lobatus]GGN84635.1 universal stress protein [Actinoplanes lobatus]GIE38132.1 universal stress protein [Actinoplanes lobatus]
MNANHLIVVGVDGSDGGRRALEWAVREAAGSGCAVQAVTAWSWVAIEYGPSPDEERNRATALLDREIAAVMTAVGGHHTIAAEVLEGRPADVLTAAAQAADLLVLGSHGHGRVRHTMLGSVSESCVRKAPCPVVVIPAPAGRSAPATPPVPRQTAAPA